MTTQFNCRLAPEIVALIGRIADEQASSQSSVITQAVKLLARKTLENKGEAARPTISRNPK